MTNYIYAKFFGGIADGQIKRVERGEKHVIVVEASHKDSEKMHENIKECDLERRQSVYRAQEIACNAETNRLSETVYVGTGIADLLQYLITTHPDIDSKTAIKRAHENYEAVRHLLGQEQTKNHALVKEVATLKSKYTTYINALKEFTAIEDEGSA